MNFIKSGNVQSTIRDYSFFYFCFLLNKKLTVEEFDEFVYDARICHQFGTVLISGHSADQNHNFEEHIILRSSCQKETSNSPAPVRNFCKNNLNSTICQYVSHCPQKNIKTSAVQVKGTPLFEHGSVSFIRQNMAIHNRYFLRLYKSIYTSTN